MLKRAIYPGTFDTLTLGHLNIIERAARLFERVFVAVGENPKKKPLFTREERLAALREECERFGNVDVAAFDGLTVEFARENDAYVIIRGLRAVTDFEYELQIAIANQHLFPELETIFLPSEPAFSFLSSSVVKEIARHGGDMGAFVPKSVSRALREKFGATKA